MGIFSRQSQSSAYLPPQTGDSSTLLGSGIQPVSAPSDDLNRSPATTVELRFRHVILRPQDTGLNHDYDTGFDHAYIVITDNRTGAQTVHQASPGGPQGNNWMPLLMGTIDASTEAYSLNSNGYRQPYRKVASFDTDASPESVSENLDSFGKAFNKKSIPYTLPDVRIPFVTPNRHPLISTPNSNYYGGAAWEFLTGAVPELPQEIDAPGWGDHRLDENR